MDQLIQKKKEEFEISSHIPKETIKTQIKIGSFDPNHQGTKYPVCNAELSLVSICIQMGKIRQPLAGGEAISLMNDMIRDTNMSESLTEFQKLRTTCSQSHGSVGRSSWHNFQKRHADLIVTKKREKFASIH